MQVVDRRVVDQLHTTAFIVVAVTSRRQWIVLVEQPGRTPLRLLLGETALEVGRDCAGLVLTDPQISRRHLSLQLRGDTVRVADLGSRNGTFVDGTRISGMHRLGRGESVRFGASTISLWAASSITSVAAREPLDIAALPTDLGSLTVVRSDIDNAARLAIGLGADRWEAVLETHNATVRTQASRHGGRELEARAAEHLHGFASADHAISFLIDLYRALQLLAKSRPADTAPARAGVHAAELLVGDDGELVGQQVTIASVLAGAARGGEILVTGIVRELVEVRNDFQFGPPRLVALDGVTREHLVHPVLWAPRPTQTTYQQLVSRGGT